jgi:mono/diheme cytochrome c family protein
MDSNRWTQPRRRLAGVFMAPRGMPSRWLGLLLTIGTAASAVAFALRSPPGVAASEVGSAGREIAEGRQIFARMECFYCHRIGSRGGRLGPALDRGSGSKRSPAFLRAHFQNPAAVVPGSAMPIIAMSDAEERSLILYLQSLTPGARAPLITLPEVAIGSAGPQPSFEEGQALYRAAACDNCHLIAGRGVAVGPALDSFGRSGRKAPWLLAHFHDPDEVAPGTPMPPVVGTPRQLQSLASYLLSLRAVTSPTTALGQRVYAQRNCGYCHGSNGRGGQIGPRLAGVRQRRWTDAWLFEHTRDPAAVTPHSRMPRVWMSEWELQSLLDYMRVLWLQDPGSRQRRGARPS